MTRSNKPQEPVRAAKALSAQRLRRWLARMPERFIKWCPPEVSEATVSLLSLHDDRHGLVIHVQDAGRTFQVSFGATVRPTVGISGMLPKEPPGSSLRKPSQVSSSRGWRSTARPRAAVGWQAAR